MLQLDMRKNTLKDFTKKISKQGNGCWHFTGHQHPDGYGTFTIDGKRYQAHRFSYEHFKGPIVKNLYVCHTCDNRICVNPAHLWLGTHDENQKDKALKGRSVRGEKQVNHKLTEEQVLKIRKDPRPRKKIAEDYKISYWYVSDIKSKKNWKHI